MQTGNITITEPMTLLTNLFLGLACFIGFFVLLRSANRSKMFVWYYSLFLVFTGVSAILGGIFSHGFKEYFSIAFSIPGWICAVMGGNYAAKAAVLHAREQQVLPVPLQSANAFNMVFIGLEIVCGIAILMVILLRGFYIVSIYSALTLGVVALGFELKIFTAVRDRGSRLFLMAIGWSLLSLIIHLWVPDIHPQFNSNDLAHIVMVIAVVFFTISFTKMESSGNA